MAHEAINRGRTTTVYSIVYTVPPLPPWMSVLSVTRIAHKCHRTTRRIKTSVDSESLRQDDNTLICWEGGGQSLTNHSNHINRHETMCGTDSNISEQHVPVLSSITIPTSSSRMSCRFCNLFPLKMSSNRCISIP